jgi:hypothetical protein
MPADGVEDAGVEADPEAPIEIGDAEAVGQATCSYRVHVSDE